MKRISKILTTLTTLLCLNYSPINANSSSIQSNVNLTYSNPKELSSGINMSLKSQLGNFTPYIETSLIYHSNFNGLNKSGLESKISGKLKYETNEFGIELGTIFWNGIGELNEFTQQTGIVKFNINDFFISYENDNKPFYSIRLGDGYDSFRTAVIEVGHEKFSIKLNIFTGKRTTGSNFNKDKIINPYTGIYGEYYKNKIAQEESYPYRSTTLMLNFKDIQIQNQKYTFQIGIDSEWIRHFTQNTLHKIIGVPEFQMMDDKYKFIIGLSSSN
jgi:hypothetical protein